MSDFLALAPVIAGGGSRPAPVKIVEAVDFEPVKNRARVALAIAPDSSG